MNTTKFNRSTYIITLHNWPLILYRMKHSTAFERTPGEMDSYIDLQRVFCERKKLPLKTTTFGYFDTHSDLKKKKKKKKKVVP